MTTTNRAYKYYDFITALFVAVLLISNIASSAKIIDWGISIFGLPLAFDAGTLLFPISYIFGDILTEVYGYKKARRVIWSGFGAALLMALTFWIVGLMPGEAFWQEYAGQNAYDAILGGVATGGIVIASLGAYFAGEFSNSYILARMKVEMQGRQLWARTIGSTMVGEGVDTVIFIILAALFGVFPWEIVSSLIIANYIFKVAIEILFTPITYAIVGFLKKSEQEDYYDRETDFNPFSLAS
ncbi:MAG: queuosine precursor transporter [Anaerolineae bacterium]|nr:queuosine precursor transporter [Anaerolineae bacterium]